MELRDRIIKSAMKIFSEVGYEKATIAQIVGLSGSSKGGFYHHFESKKDILNEITNMFLDEVVEGCKRMISDSEKDTVYLLNNVFNTVNEFKKQRLNSWQELTNLYAHEDSESIRYNMYIRFIDITTEIYKGLILKGIDEGLFSPSSPSALASMWCREVTRLYGLINTIITSGAPKYMYEDFLEQAHFVEATVNHALCPAANMISIVKPAKEYLDTAIETMKKMNSLENK